MKPSRRTAVYMAECRDVAGNTIVKVGMGYDVLDRLPSLQVGCPYEFERVRFVYLPDRQSALVAERRCHMALKKYHLRGEWFIALAGDAAALTAFDCFHEVIAAHVKGPVKVGCLDIGIYDKVRKQYQHVFGRGWAVT